MRVKLLRVGLLCFALFPFARMYFSGVRQIGYFSEVRDGRADLSVGSDPIVLAWAILAIPIFAALLKWLPRLAGEGAPRTWRRIGADAIDFVFSLSALSAIFALVPLWLEARRTGQFAWQIEKHGSSEMRGFLPFVDAFILMFLILCYFAVPVTLGKQTVGGCIMRIRMTSPLGDDGKLTFRLALRRAWYEFLWACLSLGGIFGGSHFDQARRERIFREAAVVLVANK